MSLGVKVHLAENGLLMYECPGCKHSHSVQTVKPFANGAGPWTWNGDAHKPTINPSVHVQPYRHPNGKLLVKGCHHWVREGTIIYLPDCDHELAGQTVPMEDWT